MKNHTINLFLILMLLVALLIAGCGGGGGSGGDSGDGEDSGDDGDNDEEPTSFAPADQHAFNNRVTGIRLQASPQQYIDFLSQNRFIYAKDGQKYRGSYTYSKTVLHTGELTMNFYNLNPSPCTIQLTFTSDTDKITTFGCNEGESDSSVWQLTDIPAAHAPADSVAFSRLFEGRRLITYSESIEIMPQGRFSRTYISTNTMSSGSYTYSQKSQNEGLLILDFDYSSSRFNYLLTFDSPTAGTYDFESSTGNSYTEQNWHMVSVEKMAGEVFPDCLFLQVDAIAVFKTTVGSKHSCLSLYFDDPAEELNYTASSSNGRIVSTRISDGMVILIPHSQGTATVRVTATDPNTSNTISQEIPVSVGASDPSNFNIDLLFTGPFTTDQKAMFEQAASRWESIITGDIADTQSNLLNVAGDDISFGLIDDLLIEVKLVEIDGPAGTWGNAEILQCRPQSFLPVTGIVRFDIADINDMSRIDFLDTAVHEMGHVLGIGSILWDKFGFLQNPSLDENYEPIDPAPDTYFSGPQAIEAFNNVGGANYRGEKVPVENGEEWGAGSRDSHWRESVFGNEIMSTVGVRDVIGPVSAISIQSLADLGYSVDVSQADPYRLPSPGTASRRAPEDQIHHYDDVIRGPIQVIDTDGNVVDIIE